MQCFRLDEAVRNERAFKQLRRRQVAPFAAQPERHRYPEAFFGTLRQFGGDQIGKRRFQDAFPIAPVQLIIERQLGGKLHRLAVEERGTHLQRCGH